MSSVLLTGASRGIGRAVAVELTDRGHRVIATARDPRTLDDLPVAARLRLDVTDRATIDDAVAAAGEVDVLVSNAGAIFYAAVETIPLDAMRELFEQNLFGALQVAQAVLPGMRRRGAGRLLFLSSILGRHTAPLSGAYAATKWALECLAQTLAQETAEFGIDVGLLEPGAVSSGALDEVRTYRLPDDPYAELLARRRAGYGPMISPADVAREIADAVDAPDLPLRIPVGDVARQALAG
jgi:NAD(P)-dependent dehydrogenase (short-subunit alcohol dehydrogenase family)